MIGHTRNHAERRRRTVSRFTGESVQEQIARVTTELTPDSHKEGHPTTTEPDERRFRFPSAEQMMRRGINGIDENVPSPKADIPPSVVPSPDSQESRQRSISVPSPDSQEKGNTASTPESHKEVDPTTTGPDERRFRSPRNPECNHKIDSRQS
ncbi:hypothetical protein BDZ89DRAFT_1046848 [Hymenopellis radicata]|nr:hypothetical protein BDZ89DRAFT_1046848 [Hymenopellis radicata]